MSIIQQPTLFDIDYLEKLDIQEKYKEIFSSHKNDLHLKLSVGFPYFEAISSEATYYRVVVILANNPSVIEQINQSLLQLINEELDIFEENIAIDVTAIEVRTKPVKTEEILEKILNSPPWGVGKNSKGKNDLAIKPHLQVLTRANIFFVWTLLRFLSKTLA